MLLLDAIIPKRKKPVRNNPISSLLMSMLLGFLFILSSGDNLCAQELDFVWARLYPAHNYTCTKDLAFHVNGEINLQLEAVDGTNKEYTDYNLSPFPNQSDIHRLKTNMLGNIVMGPSGSYDNALPIGRAYRGDFDAAEANNLLIAGINYYLGRHDTTFLDKGKTKYALVREGFIVKYDDKNNLQWFKKSHPTDYRKKSKVSYANDNVLWAVSGNGENFELIDENGNRSAFQTFPNNHEKIGLAKFSKTGNLIWQKTITSDNVDWVSVDHDILLLDNGEFYLSGVSIAHIDLDPSPTLDHYGSVNPFYYLAKYDASANLIWAQTFEGDLRANTFAPKMAVDNNKDIWLAINYGDSISFGPPQNGNYTKGDKGGQTNSILFHINKNGTFKQSIPLTATKEIVINDLHLHENQHPMVTGHIWGKAYTDPRDSSKNHSFNHATAYIAYYKNDGSYVFSHAFKEGTDQSYQYLRGMAVTTDDQDNLYILTQGQQVQDYDFSSTGDSAFSFYGNSVVLAKYNMCSTRSTTQIKECLSYTVPSGDETYYKSGLYYDTLVNAAGCDSILEITLEIDRDTSIQKVYTCQPYTWKENGQTYNNPGFYYHRLTDSDGCDSTLGIEIINQQFIRDTLYLRPSKDALIRWDLNAENNVNVGNDGRFMSFAWTWNGNPRRYRGLIDFDLSVLPENSVIEEGRLYLYGDKSNTGSTSGHSTMSGSNESDFNRIQSSWQEATVTWDTQPNIDPNPFATLAQSTTQYQDYQLDVTQELVDKQANPSNHHGFMLQLVTKQHYRAMIFASRKNADTTLHPRLRIIYTHGTNIQSDSVVACESYTWPQNGKTYTESGRYADTLVSKSTGCDSIIELLLTIHPRYDVVQEVDLCDEEIYHWDVNGGSYTKSGTYEHLGRTRFGCDSLVTLHLSLGKSDSSSIDVSACESYTWNLNGQTYNQSGQYESKTLGQDGCDSTIILNLEILESSSSSESVTTCKQYTWPANGQTYTQSGNYQHTKTNAAGCDSLMQLDLILLESESISENVSLCDQNQYTWPVNGLSYSSSGTYQAVFTNRFNCDSTHILNLSLNKSEDVSINHAACNQYTWPTNNQSYTQSGSYVANLKNRFGCDSTVTLNLTINRDRSATQTVDACENYYWSATNRNYNSSGTFRTVIPTQAGCDSSVTLKLTIHKPTSYPSSVTLCDQSYTWTETGQTYTQSGKYQKIYTDQYGCDSIRVLNLNIYSSNSSLEEVTTCESYYWSATQQSYTQSGQYSTVLSNQYGCDSTANLNLTIHYNNTGFENVEACDNYFWTATGQTYTQSGSYTSTLANQYGCDSLATLNLIIHPSNGSSQAATSCDSYLWPENGVTYNQTGSYTHTLQNQFGCDSIIRLNLTIHNSNSGTESHSVCESYTWPANGVTYTQSGSYSTLLKNQYGCDSTANLNLTVSYHNSGQESITACDRYFWSATGQNYVNSGTYTAQLTNKDGCDSTATLNLTINRSNGSFQSQIACDSYQWPENGQSYSQSGTYTHTLQNQFGCDSLITLDLQIKRSTASTRFVTQCDDPYTWDANGQTYQTSGTYYHTLTNQVGCDSTLTLNLNIYFSKKHSLQETACDSFYWADTDSWYYQSGFYATTLSTQEGCDSLLTLNLTINEHDSTFQSATACDSYLWSSNGQVYNASGRYIHPLQNQYGCDSTVVLDLTILRSTSGNESQTACESYTWPTNNITYTQSGRYFDTLTNQVGCDSVVSLDLSILRNSSATQTESACNRFVWHVNGQEYTSSGSYQETITNTAGCDSTITLDLLVNYSDTTDLQQTACDSFFWDDTQNWYYSSGLYQATLQNQFGCDSVVRLDLTINYSDNVSQLQSVCEQYTWPANGQTYTQSGIYNTTLQNRFGCDSNLTLDLTVNYHKDSTLFVRACDAYTWDKNGKTYTQSTLDKLTISSFGGCDSVIYLDLTVVYSNSGSEDISACGEYTWEANNKTYYQSGSYSTTLINKDGCDSLATINLDILPLSYSTSSLTICGTSYYWADSDSTYNESGSYQAILPAANGCDSTITLNLNLVEIDRELRVQDDFVYAPFGNDGHEWWFCPEDQDCQKLAKDNEPSLYPQQNGNYMVVLQKDICRDTILIPFSGIDCEQPFYIPNSFTPNGDLVNDVFTIEQRGCALGRFDFKIFDRWGGVVFKSSDPNFEWRGDYKGKALPIGTYTYHLNYELIDFVGIDRKELTGSINLLK